MVANARPSLTQLLLQPETIEQLRDRFRYIRENLTTTIHEAAALTKLSETQLRYAEERGMLLPNRAVNTGADLSQTRGQRRYTADDLLRAHLISFMIGHGYSLTEISTFMTNNRAVIQEVLQTQALRLRPTLDTADDIQFNRFYLPRVLYYTLSLIFERDAMTDAGIIIPVRATSSELADLAPDAIESADDLIQLGPTLVAWCSRGRPVMAFLTSGNPFAREQRICLTPFAALLGSGSQERAASAPTHAYIAYESQVSPELEQANRIFDIRMTRARPANATMRRLANPRVVASRLLFHAQRLACALVAAGEQADSGSGDILLYTAPELVNPALGDALLTRLADTIVELGGESLQSPESSRWRFSCVLTPREPTASLKDQELVVRAQSREGPHRVGVTTTSPKANGGLTIRASSSGRITYRPHVTSLDPAVSYSDVEAPVRSAIAAPTVEGHGAGHSQSPAVIYITSREDDAFNDDDFLMIRVLGRLVGELAQTYLSRGHQASTLTDTLANPDIVDLYFAEFRSDTDFMHDVRKMLNPLGHRPRADEQAEPDAESDADPFCDDVHTLTFVGLDVNDFAAIEQRQGSRVARMLIRELGSRAQQRMNISFNRGIESARLYRAWGDRFYMLVRGGEGDESDETRRSVERIRQDINGVYHVDGDTLTSSHGTTSGTAVQPAVGISVGVRMAGMALTRAELLAQLESTARDVPTCVASLTRLLDDGLQQANETPQRSHRSLWWNAEHKRFE